jgi:hypothetical protein
MTDNISCMENQPSQNTPERTFDYLVKNFEEITEEDIVKNRQNFSLNNLCLTVSNLEDKISYLEKLGGQDTSHYKLYISLKETIKKTGFDSARFFELWGKEMSLGDEFSDLSVEAYNNKLKMSDESPIIEKFKCVGEEIKKLRTEIDKLLLPLYKEMRRMGFEHNNIVG